MLVLHIMLLLYIILLYVIIIYNQKSVLYKLKLIIFLCYNYIYIYIYIYIEKAMALYQADDFLININQYQILHYYMLI